MNPAARTATILLTLVAMAHALRIVFRLNVTIGAVSIPTWPSAAACVVAGGVAFLLWRESRM
jgi:hypothetical protein